MLVMQVAREIINILQAIVHILEVTLSPSDHGNKRWNHALSRSLGIELWVRLCKRYHGFDHFFEDLSISSSSSVPIHCDNQAVVFIADKSTFHERTTCIEIDCHYIREKVMFIVISTPHIASSH